MNPRTAQILQAVIREFIETGSPVSSKKLCQKCDFGVKDATIRNELNALIQDGFLEQPHISSGRVPTDKGYRLIVEQLLKGFFDDFQTEVSRAFQDLSREFAAGDFRDFVEDLSHQLEVLSVGYQTGARDTYKSGLQTLFSQLIDRNYEIDSEAMFQIVSDFEGIDERVDDLLNTLSGGEPKIFIGRSPITKSRELAVIADKYEIDGGQFLVAAVGLKRMDYAKNIGFFKKLRIAIEK